MAMAMDRLSTPVARAVDEYYEKCRIAEQHRGEEVHAAVVLQSCWRGCLQRKELRKLSHVALTIQRCWRGYLGRQRFAAARSANNQQLRQAYFAQQATVIQKCWRGYFSRSRIHDYYKRKAYLAAVSAANAAVRAGMAAELAEALSQQQQQAEQSAKQHFDAQVNRLHHLASTASIPGIFNPPAAAVTGELPVVAGLPLEHHLRNASKQQAMGAVKQQQAALRQTVAVGSKGGGFTFPAGCLPASRTGSATGAAGTVPSSPTAAAGTPTATAAAAATAAGRGMTGTRPYSGVSAAASTVCAHSSGSFPGTLRGVVHCGEQRGKLASMVVAAVDDAYAVRADPNMPDGSFNPGLSLQQSTGYNAEAGWGAGEAHQQGPDADPTRWPAIHHKHQAGCSAGNQPQ